jgi:hypothetical protein
MKIEKDWTTAAGLRAVVVATVMGHRCGYVGVPASHKLHGIGYDNEPLYDIEVHGGLTYAGSDKKYPVESELHWFGFDCAHLYDARDPDLMDDQHREMHEKYPSFANIEGVIRSLSFCERECERLASQLATVVDPSTIQEKMQ